MTDRQLVIVAALTLLVGVAAGAFGAHGLRRVLTPEAISVWQTAVLYHLLHGVAMLAIAALGARFGSPLLGYAGTVMFAGIILFSGSLYLLALTGAKWLGPITPIGGAAFIVAWAMVTLAAYRSA